jgi:pimeloyl-ACP methyl ester carboxylesterase
VIAYPADEPKTSFYSVRGLRLAYHAWGDPSARPLLLIHGFQDHGKSYARTIRALGGAFYCITPDMRGHGESGWVGDGGDYVFYDYFNDMLTLVDQLGFERFGVVGHSMGGGVSTGFASLLPSRIEAMVLIEGMGFLTHDLKDTIGRLVRWSTALRRDGVDANVEGRRRGRQTMAGVEEAVMRLRQYNLKLDPDHALDLARSFTEPADDGSGAVVWRFDPLHKTPAAKPYLFEEAAAIWQALDMPVLSLFGAESPWIAPDIEARHRAIPDLRIGMVEGSGHNIHHDRPEVVADAIRHWMSAERRRGPLPHGIREEAPAPTA